MKIGDVFTISSFVFSLPSTLLLRYFDRRHGATTNRHKPSTTGMKKMIGPDHRLWTLLSIFASTHVGHVLIRPKHRYCGLNWRYAQKLKVPAGGLKSRVKSSKVSFELAFAPGFAAADIFGWSRLEFVPVSRWWRQSQRRRQTTSWIRSLRWRNECHPCRYKQGRHTKITTEVATTFRTALRICGDGNRSRRGEHLKQTSTILPYYLLFLAKRTFGKLINGWDFVWYDGWAPRQRRWHQ